MNANVIAVKTDTKGESKILTLTSTIFKKFPDCEANYISDRNESFAYRDGYGVYVKSKKQKLRRLGNEQEKRKNKKNA